MRATKVLVHKSCTVSGYFENKDLDTLETKIFFCAQIVQQFVSTHSVLTFESHVPLYMS